MISPEALTRLRLLVGAGRTPLVAGEPDRELPPIQPGQAVDGRVEQQTRAGFVVSISGRTFEIKLPDGTRTGDLLRMVYINENPRPTFALLRIDRAPVQTQPESKLSDAGKLLSTLQQIQAQSPGDPPAADTSPIFPSTVPESTHAAVLLRDALTQSGLFYESHQAQWVLGARTTAQLQLEPQGKLAPLPPDGAATNAPTHPSRSVKDTPPATEQTSPQRSHEPETSAETGTPARTPAHPDSFPIIRQQLSVLESGHAQWRGVVWPGQVMEWRVSQDTREAHAQDEQATSRESGEAQLSWSTELRLVLPNMGEVTARIELDAGGARLRLAADTPAHAQTLRENATSLADRFGAAGIAMHSLEVRGDQQAP